MASNSNKEQIEKAKNVFEQMYNPLRSLTATEVERLISDSHHGDDAKLQCIFSQIEIQSPIYQVCISKRTSGVINRKWTIEPKDESVGAKKQANEIQKMFADADTRNEDGLTDALKWLVMSNFRGRAAIKPFFDEYGLYFKKIQNWNLLEYQGKFYWNPSSRQTGWFQGDVVPNGIVEVPKSEICYLLNDSPIDIPGLLIYLRQLVGEETWARFIEKEGVPQVILQAPSGTPDTALDVWNYRAQQIFEGGSGTLPNGTTVDQLTAARGQDPFTSFVQHQMEAISILATGGTLMTIGGSTGLGSDLARVQQESFNSLVNQDCKRISNAITNTVVKKCAKQLGYDEVLCRFTFTEDAEYSANDYLDMAVKLNNLGIKLDASKLKDITKLDFIDDSEKEWTPAEPNKEWSPEDKETIKESEEFKLNA